MQFILYILILVSLVAVIKAALEIVKYRLKKKEAEENWRKFEEGKSDLNQENNNKIS